MESLIKCSSNWELEVIDWLTLIDCTPNQPCLKPGDR